MKNTQCDKCGLNAPTYYRLEFCKNVDEDRIEIDKQPHMLRNAVPCVENGFHTMELCQTCFAEMMVDFNTRRDKWKNAFPK